jgi:DNA repair exonuclease SbcCD nuclease subunit
MKRLFLFILLFNFLSAGCNYAAGSTKKKSKFRFAFFTDIHLNKGKNNCFQGFEKAIRSAKEHHVDFILTGGDNVDIDVLGKDAKTANELYGRYAQMIATAGIEYHAAVGNHDRFWGSEKNDPLYNDGLFEKYINKSYYSFNHKGWHFIVLNTSNSVVDEQQKQWLANDLKNTDSDTPVIVVVHVPFLSVYYPALQGKYTSADTLSNFKKIWDMFDGKNLKLVLQGHMHLYEEIKVRDVQFITAGAVSANWWGGPYHGTEEGFLLVNINGDTVDWKYIDYGWNTKK